MPNIRKDDPLEERGENEHKFDIHNKTDRNILIIILIIAVIAIALIVLAVYGYYNWRIYEIE
ncbi:MAG: hypothetical protein LUC16_02825 [Coprobacillus sp.]|nr:hypothetical protein [Coprobacillus sp.]